MFQKFYQYMRGTLSQLERCEGGKIWGVFYMCDEGEWRLPLLHSMEDLGMFWSMES